MQDIYVNIVNMVNEARNWLDTHRHLGAKYLAPMCAAVFFLIGFWFLLRSLGKA